ncbi:MAG: arsenic-transporting ATPase [Proteobacteria bacterium]|nr:MAG: arsenic-transporting ATPase [Pseudomonadota bacterium]
MLLEHPVLFLAGKGGVGKTTVAAATALANAKAGRRTLLVSTDPAHNLGDLFGVQFTGGAIQRVAPCLDALEIDPDIETERYLATVKDNMRRLIRSTMLEEAERQIDLAGRAPGAAEAAMLERIVAVLLDERAGYERVVFDTAPTGHTVRLLTLPELMGAWVDGLVKRREQRNRERSAWVGGDEAPEDPVFELLHRRRHRLAEARRLLLDAGVCAFVFVLIPEALPIAETRRGIDDLGAHGMNVAGLVVNRLLPETVSEPFFHRRLERERQYLARIDRELSGHPQIRLPLLEHDVDSLQALEILLAHLH